MYSTIRVLLLMPVLSLVGCATLSTPPGTERDRAAISWHIIQSSLNTREDLVTAGLGLNGLRNPSPPERFEGEAAADHLRRQAIWSNWRGLVDLTATGGFGPGHPGPAQVAGLEFHALVLLDGRRQPFRVMVQVPGHFDSEHPCLVVAPVSGSRGIYGSVPVASVWALPRGCVVAATDKGAGTDVFDYADQSGVGLDGQRVRAGETVLAHSPLAPSVDRPVLSLPHAHSGDHPEADWGRHVTVSAWIAIGVLNRLAAEQPDRFARRGGYTPESMRIIAAGISNGGSAVLRALEQDQRGLFDAAIAAMPNITGPDGRFLYDYATEAALFQPCLLADPASLGDYALATPLLVGPGRQRCESLYRAGLIPEPAADAARRHLIDAGFDTAALSASAINVSLHLWQTIGAVYAASYLRSAEDPMPCGFAIGAIGPDGQLREATEAERRGWWSLGSGTPGSAGIGLYVPVSDTSDPAFEALMCLRELWVGNRTEALRLREAVRETAASAILPDVPVLIMHGIEDGLIPIAFSSRPYVAAARAQGFGRVVLWEIEDAQHFDSLAPLPLLGGRYQPVLPVFWRGMDHLWKVLDGEVAPGPDRRVPHLRETRPEAG
ncbi:MAG: D-(-)-3-hydroxybutyrate oligomer hydrolase [Wenzhouxiangellaceae bacterium]